MGSSNNSWTVFIIPKAHAGDELLNKEVAIFIMLPDATITNDAVDVLLIFFRVVFVGKLHMLSWLIVSHSQFSSIVIQSALHPSPSIVFPSSHVSSEVTYELPHTVMHWLGLLGSFPE